MQKYIHDLGRLARMTSGERDGVMGRRIADNSEIESAYAHVKRAEQEDYDPPAFMLRRSMPWGGATERGLYFVAYGATLDAYERVLSRMLGREDGTVDALFRFTRPVSGGYYFTCPPVRGEDRSFGAVSVRRNRCRRRRHRARTLAALRCASSWATVRAPPACTTSPRSKRRDRYGDDAAALREERPEQAARDSLFGRGEKSGASIGVAHGELVEGG